MADKLTTHGAVLATGMSADWVRKNLPCEWMTTGNNRKQRMYDKDEVERFMAERAAAKEERKAS